MSQFLSKLDRIDIADNADVHFSNFVSGKEILNKDNNISEIKKIYLK